MIKNIESTQLEKNIPHVSQMLFLFVLHRSIWKKLIDATMVQILPTQSQLDTEYKHSWAGCLTVAVACTSLHFVQTVCPKSIQQCDPELLWSDREWTITKQDHHYTWPWNVDDTKIETKVKCTFVVVLFLESLVGMSGCESFSVCFKHIYQYRKDYIPGEYSQISCIYLPK